MSDKKYYVIWIDDKCKERPGLILNAKQDGIIIRGFELVVDGLRELEENLSRYDGIILDVKCLYASKDEQDKSSGFYAARRFISQLSAKTGQIIPCFVYSGQPDYISDEELANYLDGERLYVKGADDELLLHDIKKAALSGVPFRRKGYFFQCIPLDGKGNFFQFFVCRFVYCCLFTLRILSSISSFHCSVPGSW